MIGKELNKRLDFRHQEFNEKDWLKYQKKLQTIVVESIVKKFQEVKKYQSIDESKVTFLRQQYRIIEELRDRLSNIKFRLTLTQTLKEQRIEQTKGNL